MREKAAIGHNSALRRAMPYLLGGAAVGLAVALPAALAWAFLHPPRRRHLRTPRTALGLDYERLRLAAGDGLTLSAWWIPHPAPRGVAVLSHGYTGCRETMLPYAHLLHAAGLSVLLYDFRGHGWSERARITFGLRETADLTAALDEAQRRADGLPILAVGESMGGAVTLLAAAGDERVRGVLVDCAFARLDEPIERRLETLLGPAMARTLGRPTRRLGERLLGASPADIAPETVVARIAPRPLLIVHGVADRLVPVEHARRLRDAYGDGAELWLVPDAGHARSVLREPDAYARRVRAFVDRVVQQAA